MTIICSIFLHFCNLIRSSNLSRYHSSHTSIYHFLSLSTHHLLLLPTRTTIPASFNFLTCFSTVLLVTPIASAISSSVLSVFSHINPAMLAALSPWYLDNFCTSRFQKAPLSLPPACPLFLLLSAVPLCELYSHYYLPYFFLSTQKRQPFLIVFPRTYYIFFVVSCALLIR